MRRWAVLGCPGVASYLVIRFAVSLAVQVQSVAVGWYIYAATDDPLYLGLVGLSQFFPTLALVLITGAAADRFSRRGILAVCLVAKAICATAILVSILADGDSVWTVLASLLGFGIARAFFNPAQQSLLPNLVPTGQLASAIALNVAVLKLGTVVGPLLGGVLYAILPVAAFAAVIAALAAAFVPTLLLPRVSRKPAVTPRSWGALLAGFGYIRSRRAILGAVTLDLFVVLLGGVTALLPVYARDVLHIGPVGLGVLAAAPAVGTIAVAFYLTQASIGDHAGRVLFISVAVSGLAILVFGISTVPVLSVVALAINGGADMVSVYVRHTLVQLWTPDELRGRVSGVNTVLLDASNELGAFRAGVFASVIGAVPAVVIGGVGMLGIVWLWSRRFSELLQVRRLVALRQD